jgi:anthranilate/para-aminobenzoate synthase component I
VRYDLPNRTLETTYPSGRKELLHKCDVLEFLEGQLTGLELSAGGAELPFDFRGGFVGYLGYELKELCEDGLGLRNRHVSEEPDAVMLFADRFLVWDHQEGNVYVVALVSHDTAAEAAAREWLACTEEEVRRLSSLTLREKLAARHEGMREPSRHQVTRHQVMRVLSLPANARRSAAVVPGVAASTEGVGTPAGGDEGVLVQQHVGAAIAEDAEEQQPVAGLDMLQGLEEEAGNEPPTVDADDSGEQEPSQMPDGPGALSFPTISPTAPSLSSGPGSVPRGAMPHSDWEGGKDKDSVAAAGVPSSRESGFVYKDSERQYEDKVRNCLDYIVEGESYELCLTTRLRSRRSMRVDPLQFYQRLRTVNPAPYSALLRCGEGLTVCSSSPERFLRISAEGVCDSKPIKGTRRRGACPEEDAEICRELRRCEKDLAENLMIVDLVRNDLGRVCTEASVCCPKIFDVETYATVRAHFAPLSPRRCVLRVCHEREMEEERDGGER